MRKMKKLYRTISRASLAGMASLMPYTFVFAYGEDVLAEPTRNLFATFVGTGINLLLLIEIVAAAYFFTTQRKIAVWVGLPIIILITAYAKVKFG